MCEEIITCKLEPRLTENLQPSLDKSYCPGPCFLRVSIQITGGCALFLKGSVIKEKFKREKISWSANV